jgi:hypothetical protein
MELTKLIKLGFTSVLWLYADQYRIAGMILVFLRDGMILFLTKKILLIFLQVIHTMVHWIHLWRFLLLEDEREGMVSGCNRLQMVARDIFYQITWWTIKRLEDALIAKQASYFSVVDICIDPR